MPLPFSFRGILVATSRGTQDLDRMVTAVEEALRREKPTILTREGERIRFESSPFRFVSGGNQLVSISSGELVFQKQPGWVEIRYRISFLKILLMVTAMSGWMLWMMPGTPWHIVVMMWLWLFGGNCVLTLVRFPRFVRKAAEGE